MPSQENGTGQVSGDVSRIKTGEWNRQEQRPDGSLAATADFRVQGGKADDADIQELIRAAHARGLDVETKTLDDGTFSIKVIGQDAIAFSDDLSQRQRAQEIANMPTRKPPRRKNHKKFACFYDFPVLSQEYV